MDVRALIDYFYANLNKIWPYASLGSWSKSLNSQKLTKIYIVFRLKMYSISFSLDYGPFFALDNVLSHMDDTEYGIGNSNTLDQIAHGMHMHHMWNCASKKYKVS